MNNAIVLLVPALMIAFSLQGIGASLRRISKQVSPPAIAPDGILTVDPTPGRASFKEPPRTYKLGDRVRAKSYAGFHAGAVGVVDFQEPSGERCWVTRDGAGSPCYYYNTELEPEA